MLNMLIADDNVQITSILSEYAKKEGYMPFVVHDGEKALDLFMCNDFSVVLLDVMMPKKDGFEVCREIRRSSVVPIIMVTARCEDFERIMGLDIGADDYIVKPFSPAEVMARVRAVMRRIERKESSIAQILMIDNLKVNAENFTAEVEGAPIALTKKEIEILWVLAKNQSKVFSRDNLLNSLWGYDFMGDSRTVDSHIKRLRAKLDAQEHPNWEIKTIWGVGYKFEVKGNA